MTKIGGYAFYKDYPRVGGEEVVVVVAGVTVTGLPPRGRGRARSCERRRPAGRITPAWAGKSESGAKVVVKHEDYPRVGGEECGRRIGTRR